MPESGRRREVPNRNAVKITSAKQDEERRNAGESRKTTAVVQRCGEPKNRPIFSGGRGKPELYAAAYFR